MAEPDVGDDAGAPAGSRPVPPPVRRSYELLWRTPEPANRGPKPGLTLGAIATAAIRIADADGLEKLSMRRLAQDLGVGAMSLYRYVPGKADLLDVMFDTVLGQLPPLESSHESWRADLTFIARRDRALYLAHPWVLQVGTSTRPPLGPNVLDTYELLLSVLDGTGLTDREIVAAVNFLDAFARGSARGAIDVAEAEEATGVTDEQWWEERTDFWERCFEADRYPTITRIYATGTFDDPYDDFEFGLERVLDGIEAVIRRRTGAG